MQPAAQMLNYASLVFSKARGAVWARAEVRQL